MPLGGIKIGAGPKYGGKKLIMDTLSVDPVWVISPRKVTTTYNGSPVRISIDTDDTNQTDIGFNTDSTWWNESDIDTHVGINNPRIVTMYDQSGNNYDFDQISTPAYRLEMDTASWDVNKRVPYANGGHVLEQSTVPSTEVPNTSDRTMVFVYKNIGTAWGYGLGDLNNSNGSGTIALYNNGKNGVYYYCAYGSGDTSKILESTHVGYVKTDLQYMIVSHDYSTAESIITVNDTYTDNYTMGGTLGVLDNCVIGARSATAGQPVTAHVIEAWCFDHILSPDDVALLADDLNSTYNI